MDDIFQLFFVIISLSLVVDTMTTHHLKFAPPRPLTSEETQLTMQRWKVNFKQYLKRDDTYRPFLNLAWDPS